MTKRRNVSSLILTLALALALNGSCRTEPAVESNSTRDQAVFRLPDELLGCYALYDSAGRPAAERLFMAPNGTRLDTLRTRNGRIGVAWRLGAHDETGGGSDEGRGGGDPGGWRADPQADTLRLVFNPGMGGTEFVLAFDGQADTLRGHALRHGDSGPPFIVNEGAVTAVRRPCRERRR